MMFIKKLVKPYKLISNGTHLFYRRIGIRIKSGFVSSLCSEVTQSGIGSGGALGTGDPDFVNESSKIPFV